MPCASALYCIGVDLLHSKLCIMVFSSLENINLVLHSDIIIVLSVRISFTSSCTVFLCISGSQRFR